MEMREYAEPIEPIYVPEVFCNDLSFIEMASPGLVRFGLFVERSGLAVLRLKVLMPSIAVPGAAARTTTFMACQKAHGVGAARGLLM